MPGCISSEIGTAGRLTPDGHPYLRSAFDPLQTFGEMTCAKA
jgi:hypothetical protein